MLNFDLYNHLGFHNPYYIKSNSHFEINFSLKHILEKTPSKTLDYTAIVEILSTGYAFADRTLIQEVKKTPWMAKPNETNTAWDYFKVPKHQELKTPENEIADTFYNLLKQEMLGYLDNNSISHIGVLLTGGMDSRIVACVLNDLLTNAQLTKKEVICYTWGNENSRDIVYARRIADLYGWQWQRLVVDTEQMHHNCDLVMDNGCEFTPIHLHAMSQVADLNAVDCVLAGSFGDSVGRAEYSGVKVQDLKSIEDKIQNIAGILRPDYLKLTNAQIKEDLNQYHQLFPEQKAYQQYEQDLELHYMRRMLNACMRVIDKDIPLFQMFTSPEVFGYIWSISPELRTDAIYKIILDKHAPELAKIPWARTGLIYPHTQGTPDEYSKKHHDYGKMIRTHFLDEIKHVFVEKADIAQQIFNYRALMGLLNNVRKYPIKGSHVYEEKLLWAACLLNFIDNEAITIKLPKNSNNITDYLFSIGQYRLKHLVKKFR